MIDLANPAYIGTFYEDLELAFNGSWSGQVGWLNPDSSQETEDYRWLGAVPAFREWLGGRQAKGLRTEAFQIRNKIWEQTLEFDVDDLRRDKTGQVKVRLGDLATRAATHWESLVSDLINNNLTCYDGQNFFSASHVSGDSGTQKNLLAAGDYTELNVVDAGNVATPDEAAKIIQILIGHFYTMKDDQGEPINGGAKSFLVMLDGVRNFAAFTTAIKASMLSQGATNPVIAGLGGYSLTPMFNPRLTTGGATVKMFRTDAKLKPFILQEELGTQTQIIGAGSEEEVKNNRHLFGTKAIRNAGYGLWQYGLSATLS